MRPPLLYPLTVAKAPASAILQHPWLSHTDAEDGYGVGLCTRLRHSTVVARERRYGLRMPCVFPHVLRNAALPRYGGNVHAPPCTPTRQGVQHANPISVVPAVLLCCHAGYCA